MHQGIRILGLVAVMLVGGCAVKSDPISLWVRQEGGTVASANPSQARLESVAKRLTRGRPDLQISVYVLASDMVTAYSWPNHHIFVARGLMNRVDDNELAAVLAHELGHLLDRSHVPMTMASLRGCDKNLVIEARADAIGSDLLQRQGCPTEAMITMLGKIECSGTLPQFCRLAMEQRMALLRSHALRLEALPMLPTTNQN